MTGTPARRRALSAEVAAQAIAGRLPGGAPDQVRVTIEHGRDTWTGTPAGLAVHIADALHPPRPGSSQAPVPEAELNGWLRDVVTGMPAGEALAPGDVQALYVARFRTNLCRSDARSALYVMRDEGLLVVDDSRPARRVYRRATQEKTTLAGAAVTPGLAPRATEAATLVALARALREQPAVDGWVPALSRLPADHLMPLGEVTETEVSAAGHETVIADRIRAHCGKAGLPADTAAIEITAWHIRPLLTRIAELEAAVAQPVTEYLAAHESFPVGRYDNRAAAVEHIEAFLVQEEGEQGRDRIVWSGPEDPDEEVPVWDVALRSPVTGELIPTQYMVTAIPLASVYDPEAEG